MTKRKMGWVIICDASDDIIYSISAENIEESSTELQITACLSPGVFSAALAEMLLTGNNKLTIMS